MPGQKTRDEIDALGYERPLVAIDGSPSSLLALSLAIATASATAKLIMAAVSPDVELSEPWVAEAASPEALQRDVDREIQEKLDDALGRIPEHVSAEAVLCHGSVGSTIVELAAKSDCDVILLGARGLGRIGAALGSVSQYVLHHADLPVLIAHAPDQR
jgi:nucleotide-binding universal stress UspA family protein